MSDTAVDLPLEDVTIRRWREGHPDWGPREDVDIPLRFTGRKLGQWAMPRLDFPGKQPGEFFEVEYAVYETESGKVIMRHMWRNNHNYNQKAKGEQRAMVFDDFQAFLRAVFVDEVIGDHDILDAIEKTSGRICAEVV